MSDRLDGLTIQEAEERDNSVVKDSLIAELKAEIKKLKSDIKGFSYDATYWNQEYWNLFTKIEKCLGIDDDEVQVNINTVSKALRGKADGA